MISILNQRGGNHNSCEDSVFVKETELAIYGGVFDGCSTGVNSHWASQTMAYLFESNSSAFKPTSVGMAIEILFQLQKISIDLNINPNTQLLSTCVLFYYNKSSKRLEVRCFGDGVYYVNDIEYVVDQGNIPDYIAYQVYNTSTEQVEFIDKYGIAIYENVDKFIICSDGIQAIKESQYEEQTVNWQEMLLAPPKSENYLKRMWNILKSKKFTLSDDLTIVSYANS